MRITVLAGGVGSARFCSGLLRVADPAAITIVVNTGDDETVRGLQVCPDIDTVLYHLADLADWERALAGITAGGATSCGVALKYLQRKKQYVEQIILISDEGQNTPPTFVDALEQYRTEMKASPIVNSTWSRSLEL